MSIFTIISNNNNAPTSSIVWYDTETTENRVGVFNSVEMLVASIVDIEGSTIYSLWQINTGNGFIDNIFVNNQNEIFNITAGVTQFRLKNTDAFGMIGYSNILQYSYNPPIYDNFNAFYDEFQGCDFVNWTNFNISFNNGPGVFNLGINYIGSLPSILRILSITTSVIDVNNPYEASLATLGNVAITVFPYNIPLSNFSVGILPIKILEPYVNLRCPATGNVGQVTITIEYEVFDANGISGGVKQATVVNTYDQSGSRTLPPLPPNPTYPLPTYNVCFQAGTTNFLDCQASAIVHNITYINAYGQIQNASGPNCQEDVNNPGTLLPQQPIAVHQIISGNGYQIC